MTESARNHRIKELSSYMPRRIGLLLGTLVCVISSITIHFGWALLIGLFCFGLVGAIGDEILSKRYSKLDDDLLEDHYNDLSQERRFTGLETCILICTFLVVATIAAASTPNDIQFYEFAKIRRFDADEFTRSSDTPPFLAIYQDAARKRRFLGVFNNFYELSPDTK